MNALVRSVRSEQPIYSLSLLAEQIFLGYAQAHASSRICSHIHVRKQAARCGELSMSVEALECTVQSLESSSTYSNAKLDQPATNKTETEMLLRSETDDLVRTTLQFEKEANRRSSRASGGPAHLPPPPTKATSHPDQGVVSAARSSPPPRARQYPSSAFPQKAKGVSMVSGVGLVLERTEGSGLMIVKRIAKDSVAETDGRISINDTLLKVCASCFRFRMHLCVGFRESLGHGCALMSDTSLLMTFVCALHTTRWIFQQVNNAVVTGMELSEVLDLMKGPEGTDLHLHLRQPRSLRYACACARKCL